VAAASGLARTQRASRKMLFLRDAYIRAFPTERLPVDPKRIAHWAYERGLWRPTETPPAEILRRKLCRAFRNEYITDPQGREVRANFARVEEVMTSEGPKHMSKFYPIYEAQPEIARQAFALERRQALGTIQQMKFDFDSYNDNNKFGAKLPDLNYDFKSDIEEMGLSNEYNPDPEQHEEDEEE
jgi:hypothetical protein